MTTPTPKPGEMYLVWFKKNQTPQVAERAQDGTCWIFDLGRSTWEENVAAYVPLSDCRAVPVMREALEKIAAKEKCEDKKSPCYDDSCLVCCAHASGDHEKSIDLARAALAACRKEEA